MSKQCKARVTSGFIGGLVKCKRRIKSGKYCYQHAFLEQKAGKDE